MSFPQQMFQFVMLVLGLKLGCVLLDAMVRRLSGRDGTGRPVTGEDDISTPGVAEPSRSLLRSVETGASVP